MTEQNIPAEKVRELATKYDGDGSGDPERLLADLLRDLHGLSTPPQPTTGLLGRWAKHEEYGDVVCTWDRPTPEGNMHVRWVDESFPVATGRYYVPLSDLTFPEQATKPEEVPAGEAWLVDVEDSEESHKSIVALKDEHDAWRVCGELMTDFFWRDKEVTLISPLTPERPESDLQAKYDALDAKYREAVEKIKTLEQPSPVWRIEHDWLNLRVGEYVIDSDGDTGTVSEIIEHIVHFEGSGGNSTSKYYGPFIVFPNKDAATPEAIEEAKRARDKETGE